MLLCVNGLGLCMWAVSPFSGSFLNKFIYKCVNIQINEPLRTCLSGSAKGGGKSKGRNCGELV